MEEHPWPLTLGGTNAFSARCHPCFMCHCIALCIILCLWTYAKTHICPRFHLCVVCQYLFESSSSCERTLKRILVLDTIDALYVSISLASSPSLQNYSKTYPCPICHPCVICQYITLCIIFLLETNTRTHFLPIPIALYQYHKVYQYLLISIPIPIYRPTSA